jgi:diaminohydroxyphosphoribosylaminopyrimidine deaminase/5-amino-6-(5-phosphoribosylamino)uracil reductase
VNWDALMRRALELAAAGRYGASPNPTVGAVVLGADGRVVGEGAHRRCGGPHAEVEALGAAGPGARGGTLVVTLEPCAHHGRTPPCVDAVVAAGVRRVVIGTRDPNPQVDGRGVAVLSAAGVEVIEGVEAEACRAANPRYFHWVRTGRPYVAAKVAMSLDGKIAARGGRARWITSEESRREGHALREEFDALLVGVGTILADDPRLLRRLGLNPSPGLVRVVLDSSLRTPPEAGLLGERPQDVVICCRSAEAARRRALEATGATVVEVRDDGHGRCDLGEALRWLGGRQISSLLVEGGSEVHWAFFREGLVQRLYAFMSPLVLGGREAVPAVGGTGFATPQQAVRLAFTEVRRIGDDLALVAEVSGV